MFSDDAEKVTLSGLCRGAAVAVEEDTNALWAMATRPS